MFDYLSSYQAPAALSRALADSHYVRMLKALQDTPYARMMAAVRDTPHYRMMQMLNNSPMARMRRELHDNPMFRALQEVQRFARERENLMNSVTQPIVYRAAQRAEKEVVNAPCPDCEERRARKIEGFRRVLPSPK
jgi:hypothetical protein